MKTSTGVKDVHIDDTSVQYYVVTGTGLHVAKLTVVHVNNQYVRNGEIEVERLFAIHDITHVAKEKQAFVSETIVKLKEMLQSGLPRTDIGVHCSAPYPCDFQGHCWQHIPRGSVFDLRRIGVNRFELYCRGIIETKDIPLDVLNRAQRIQVEAFVQKKEFIDKRGAMEVS